MRHDKEISIYGIYPLICSTLEIVMRRILSERNFVAILFVMVCITFAFAHEDSKKMEQIYLGSTSSAAASFVHKSVEESIVAADPVVPVSPVN